MGRQTVVDWSSSMSSLRTGVVIISLNLGLCLLSATSSHHNPPVCVASAVLATALVATFKYRCPVWLLWPVTGLAVISQTLATSSVLPVPLTLVLSPMISLVQGFLSIPM